MKRTICDICCRPITNRQYKIKIKKETWSFHESGFDKLDVCEECADRIIFTLELKMKDNGGLKK